MRANIPEIATFQLIGPYDKRKRTTRCKYCAQQHLKCSGGLECQNCSRRKVPCEYPSSNQPGIDLSQKYVIVKSRGRSLQHLSTSPLLDRETIILKSFVDEFLSRNKLSSSGEDHDYVQSRINDSDALHYAACALGYVSRARTRTGKLDVVSSKTFGFEAYEEACRRLNAQLDSATEKDWVLLIETTILLGLFELVVSSVGKGWRRHFDWGTRALFKKLSTKACLTGEGKRIYSKFVLLEITSSMVFSSRSFLSEQPWSDLSSSIQWDDSNQALHAEVLGLTLACSNLCLPAVALAFSMSHGQREQDAVLLRPIAQQAKALRGKLEKWRLAVDKEFDELTSFGQVEAWSMYHTASLYLHNAFNVESIWTDLQIDTPQLSSKEVQIHVAKLLLIVEKALLATRICPLLFIVPLYVAASCTKSEHDRDKILTLFTVIGQVYEIANTCARQVSSYWAFKELFDQVDCPLPILKHHHCLFLGHLQNEWRV